MKKVYYIGFYSDKIGIEEGRYCSPAAVNKMDYIAKSLIRAGYEVEILSPAWSTKKEWHWARGRINNELPGLTIKYVPIIVSPFRIFKPIVYLFSKLWVFWKLLLYDNKATHSMLVYHSIFYYQPFFWAKKIKKFDFALEIEEIYNLFINSQKRKEDALISLASSYIFVNKQLTSYLKNQSDQIKNRCIVNGSYNLTDITAPQKSSGEIINVVYSGSIDDVRGAFNALKCVEYLDDNYMVYITGTGEQKYLDKLSAEIAAINVQAGFVKCQYLGLLPTDRYNDFLLKCDIAINPQDPDESYMQYAFPSKVINYLSYNLKTVSTNLRCIAESEFADLVVLVKDFSPKNFADSIMSVNIKAPFDARKRIKMVDENFVNALESFFN